MFKYVYVYWYRISHTRHTPALPSRTRTRAARSARGCRNAQSPRERKMRIARKLADGPGTCRRLSAAHRPPIAEINRLGVSVSHTSQFATSQTLYTVCRLGRCANWAHRPLERGHSCAHAPPPRSTGAVASLRVPLRATRQRCRGPRGAQAGGARRRRALRLAILFRPDGLRRCLA